MNKATPGPCKEVTIGATPHGGTYMVAYYFDSKYAPVPKHKATRIIIHEYDEKNRSIHRDYISCGPNDEEEFAAMEAYELAERPDPKLAGSPRRRGNGTEGASRRLDGHRPRARQERQASPRAKTQEESRAKDRIDKKAPQRSKQGAKEGKEARAQQKPRSEGQRRRPEGASKPRPEGQRARAPEKPKLEKPKPEGEKRTREGQQKRSRRRPNRKPKGPDHPQ
ncbi:MAG: hypothetical protein ACOYIR_07165 [Christensenellales bacterium]|jgi:hypothetical protein